MEHLQCKGISVSLVMINSNEMAAKQNKRHNYKLNIIITDKGNKNYEA